MLAFVKLMKALDLIYGGCFSQNQIETYQAISGNFSNIEEETRQKSLGRASAGRRKTSKSRKRKESRGSKHRFGKDSDSESDNPFQPNLLKVNALTRKAVDAETTQDIERLCQEIEAYEKVFDDKLKDDQQ
jgi:hypothetical protein